MARGLFEPKKLYDLHLIILYYGTPRSALTVVGAFRSSFNLFIIKKKITSYSLMLVKYIKISYLFAILNYHIMFNIYFF